MHLSIIILGHPKLWRRSIYRFVVRTTPNRFMTTLDCPDPASFTPKRLNTTTPLRSLALYNNDISARPCLAERIGAAGPKPEKQVEQAFRIVFNRPLAEGGIFIFCGREGRALRSCRSLLTNEFVYFD